MKWIGASGAQGARHDPFKQLWGRGMWVSVVGVSPSCAGRWAVIFRLPLPCTLAAPVGSTSFRVCYFARLLACVGFDLARNVSESHGEIQ